MPDTLTTKQAAEFLKLHVKTLQRLDRQGVLRPFGRTATGRRVYLKAQLEAFLGIAGTNGTLS